MLSVGVSATDIVRNVLRACAADDANHKPSQNLLKWMEGEEAAAWMTSNVVNTAQFRTVLKTPDVGIGELLEQAQSSGVPSGGPSETDVKAVLSVLLDRYKGADLAVEEDEDEGGGYQYESTVAALNKAKSQIPMLVAVQTALSMFPGNTAEKLDQHAARVGESIRKQAKQNAGNGMGPGDIIGSVMKNPEFMSMMKTVMEDVPPPQESADSRDGERALQARLKLIEMRLDRLESAPPTAGEAVNGGAPSRGSKKKKGARRNNTPTY